MAQNWLMGIMDFLVIMARLKHLLFAMALLATQLHGLARTNIDLGFPAAATPYDPYMTPVRQVLTHLTNEQNTMDRVRFLMHEGRSFRYSFTSPYVAATPDVTASTRSGDCKAKALWLADQLNDQSVRFVIGKARRTSQMSHAWLLWQHDNRWWILDCTNNWDPIAADRVSSSQYIPYYSFAKNGEYRHQATALLVAQTGTVTASRAMIAQR
jgi:hypothetical protein